MKRLVCIILALLAVVACDTVHEWPQSGREVDPTIYDADITVSCVIDLDVERIITRGAAAPVYTDEDADKYLRRFFIDIYETGPAGDSLVFTRTFTQEVVDRSKLSFKSTLRAKQHKAVVWMDYVLKDKLTDNHYITSGGLSAIRIRPVESYFGCDDFKDAQTVVYPFDLSSNNAAEVHVSIDIPLVRPVAKITFETTDFVEFAKKSGCPEDKYEDFAKNYYVRFVYNGYLPTGFNVLTQKLNDSQTGYYYIGAPVWNKDSQYTRLGFDYVFVNGTQSSVTMTVEICTLDGTVVNSVGNIVVPTFMGKETIVRDKFFTGGYLPGIGINPAFDGEFNVYV